MGNISGTGLLGRPGARKLVRVDGEAYERDSRELTMAVIVSDGQRAAREIGPARTAAQRAWQAWRDLGSYVQPDGQVNSRFASEQQPAVKRSKDPTTGEVIEFHYMQQTGVESPEHERLRELANEADRHVCDLQDALDMMRAVSR